jgi:hypothetical protein
MRIPNNFRQGDVLIFQIKKPRNKRVTDYGFKLKGDNVVMEGEITGHLHEVTNGKLYEKEDKLIVEAGKGCMLTHPEHAPIPLPQGVYEIKIQEEYDDSNPTMKNKVKD